MARELREELGLACEVGPLVAVGYSSSDEGSSVELSYRCSGREVALVPREETVVGAVFVPPPELCERGVFPLELAADLAAEGLSAFEALRYYGRFA